MVRAALWYAQRGLYVFPLHEPVFTGGECVGCTCEPWRHSGECKAKTPARWLAPGDHCASIGKCPRVYWRDKSTRDPDQIARWWRMWPTANIGIDCGKSGLVVLDADLYKDAYAGDLSALDTETVTSITGGGGEHLWYAQPEGGQYGNGKGNLPAGIDVRGMGGYIAAPPSLHKSGNRYAFEIGYAPHEIAVAPLPLVVRQRIDGDRNGAHRTAGPPNRYAVKAAAAIVESVLQQHGLETFGPNTYDGEGRRWILKTCPFNPQDNPHNEDASSFVIVLEDGHIAAGCHHNRCQERIRTAGTTAWRLLQLLPVTA
jgi:hypothetical protein